MEKRDSWLAYEVFKMKEKHEDLISQINFLQRKLDMAKDTLDILASGELPDGTKVDFYVSVFAQSAAKEIEKTTNLDNT